MTDSAGAAIRTIGLRKRYSGPRGEVEAVAGVDLTVAQGEFFGLLGPNGAGKSTTIGMLTTRVIPTGGRRSCTGSTSVRTRSRSSAASAWSPSTTRWTGGLT